MSRTFPLTNNHALLRDRDRAQSGHTASSKASPLKTDTDDDCATLSLQQMLPIILSAVMESTTELSFVKDPNLRYVCCSRGFARLAGLKHPGDATGKSDYDLFPPALADSYRNDDLELLAGGNAMLDKAEPIAMGDGVVRYVSTSKYLLRDDAGRIVGIYGIGRDITEYRAAFEQLKLLTNTIPGGLATYEISPDGMRLLYFSDGYFSHTGYSKEEYQALAANDPLCLVFEQDIQTIRATVADVLSGSESFGYEYRARSKEHDYRWLNIQGVVIERHQTTAVVNVVKLDITERKLAEEQLRISEEQYRLAQKHSGTMMCRYDVADRSLNMSAEVAALFKLPETVPDVPYELVRRGLIAPECAEVYTGFYESILHGAKTGETTYKILTRNGWCWLKAVFSSIFSDDGLPVYAVVSYEDITEQHRQAEERAELLQNERILQRQATIDGLTDLYNRSATERLIKQRLAHSEEHPCTMLITDLDNLKVINDSLGHPQGDQAIRLTAKAMKAKFRQSDIVGRIGGDEFIIYLDGVGDRPTVSHLLTELIRQISELRVGRNQDIPICISIGAAFGKTGVDSFDGLYQKADMALYYAKRNGKNQFGFYAPEEE